MSGKRGPNHIMAKRSWWSGQVTALCGFVSQRGEYETALFTFFTGTPCQECRRIKRTGKHKR